MKWRQAKEMFQVQPKFCLMLKNSYFWLKVHAHSLQLKVFMCQVIPPVGNGGTVSSRKHVANVLTDWKEPEADCQHLSAEEQNYRWIPECQVSYKFAHHATPQPVEYILQLWESSLVAWNIYQKLLVNDLHKSHTNSPVLFFSASWSLVSGLYTKQLPVIFTTYPQPYPTTPSSPTPPLSSPTPPYPIPYHTTPSSPTPPHPIPLPHHQVSLPHAYPPSHLTELSTIQIHLWNGLQNTDYGNKARFMQVGVTGSSGNC